SPPPSGAMWRLGSPSSGSILITRAPPSASTWPAHGTAMKWPNSITVTPSNGRSELTASALHERVPLRRGDRAFEIAEAALVTHLASAVEHGGHRRAIERCREGHAAHPGRLQLSDREGLALDAGHEVERLADGATDRFDGREIW